MPLETGDKIADLNENWPLGTDPKSNGDDHIRLVKSILKLDAVSLANTGSAQIVESSVDGQAGTLIVGTTKIMWQILQSDAGSAVAWTFPTPFKAIVDTKPLISALAIRPSAGTEVVVAAVDNSQVFNEIEVTLQSRLVNAAGVSGSGPGVSYLCLAIGPATDDEAMPTTVQTIGGTELQEFYDPSGVASWRIVGNTLECWGITESTADITVPFPKTFAAAPVVTASANSATSNIAVSVTPSLTDVRLVALNASNAQAARTMRWHAIGEWDGN